MDKFIKTMSSDVVLYVLLYLIISYVYEIIYEY